jgi:hypothetical protein
MTKEGWSHLRNNTGIAVEGLSVDICKIDYLLRVVKQVSVTEMKGL